MKYCPSCGRKHYSDNVTRCLDCSTPLGGGGGDTEKVLVSAAIGAVTGSALLGGFLGGSFLGGVLGDSLDGDIFGD